MSLAWQYALAWPLLSLLLGGLYVLLARAIHRDDARRRRLAESRRIRTAPPYRRTG